MQRVTSVPTRQGIDLPGRRHGAVRIAPRLAAVAVTVAMLALGGCTSVRSNLPSGQQAFGVIPSSDVSPIAERYQLAANDTISLKVFQEPELSSDALQIDPSGNIDLPLLGEVRAQGLSTSELARVLERSLSTYLREPRVSVALVESGQTITVEGAVKQPGVFPIRGRTTLIQALALAQSPTFIAANDQIFVFRTINGQRAGARFDIKRIRAGADPDPVLLPGDQVVVGVSALKEAWQEYLGTPIFNIFRVR
ncbi:MAG: polysaccharide export protein [Porphyrobacter sp.]|nr:polysaccharide export protein [Porphyrobacter sp.]